MKVKDVKYKVTLDDFEHRLLINCVNKARTLFLEQDKPTEVADGDTGDGSMCCEFQALDISARDRCLKRLRENSLSIRQISRLTGVSLNIVRKF